MQPMPPRLISRQRAPPRSGLTWFSAPLLTAALLATAACIVLPLPQGEGEVTEGHAQPIQALIHLVPGRTTRAEVEQALGEPTAIWLDHDIYVYAWDRVHWKLLWVLAGGMRAAAGIIDFPTHYILLIQFDRHGIVQRAERCVRPMATTVGAFLESWAEGAHCAPPG
jgi:outer membrane protein assembly factor BamE (lipoprotein component of BamABCDE complex)